MKKNYWKIDRKLVEHVSKVARLELSKEEKTKFTKQLEDILEAFKKIDRIDTKDVRPSFHPQEIKNVFREDQVKKWEWEPLKNTKLKEKGYFKGPKIV